MSHFVDYTKAVEQRLQWLRWARNDAYELYKGSDAVQALPMYLECLETGDTFYMNRQFCDLVNVARETIPDDLQFDQSWMLSPYGFMWLEKPITLPTSIMKDIIRGEKDAPATPRDIQISAIGWFPLKEGFATEGFNKKVGRTAGPGAYEIVCFESLKHYGPHAPDGFGCWSYFMLQHGDRVIDRIKQFESWCVRDGQEGRAYNPNDPIVNQVHEIRWVYAALHLMSQKLAVTVTQEGNRALRRRFEREKSPVPPIVRIVTLRRLEEDRKQDPQGHQMDWQWQWRVGGHWRQQWYAKEQVHKMIWIEDYIKGPIDKPLKPAQHTIYVAGR